MIHTIEGLTYEEKGKLFQHLLEYVNDMNPTLEDRLLQFVWKPIELQLKRDLNKYKAKCLKNKENGKKGGRPKKEEKNPKKPNGFSENRTKPKKADTDNDTDNDTDTDNVNDSDNISNYKSLQRFSKFRKQEFEKLDETTKTKLKNLGITKPIIKYKLSKENDVHHFSEGVKIPEGEIKITDVVLQVLNAINPIWHESFMKRHSLSFRDFKDTFKAFVKEKIIDGEYMDSGIFSIKQYYTNWLRSQNRI